MRGFNNATPGQDGRRDIVRYDSPEFSGFVVTASWGEDDLWDAALTYKGEWNGIKVLAKAGYGESTDNGFVGGTGTQCGGPFQGFNCSWWGAAATLMHMPTGLYLYGGYGQQQIESLPVGGTVGLTPAQPLGFSFDDTSTMWFLQPGIERKWHDLGKTTLFAEYRKDEAGASFGNASLDAAGLPTCGTCLTAVTLGSDVTFWAGGVVQNIEAAAMDLYVIYRHAEGSYLAPATGAKTNIDDFDMLISGARIQF